MFLNRFSLASDDCELLLLFETLSNLNEVAQVLGKDHSVVARSFKKMAEIFPVVEKKAGRWTLTDIGRAVNEVTRTAISAQTAALKATHRLRIGTNREFAAKVLCPDFKTIQDIFPKTELTINAYQQGTEAALLSGQIDIGIDCDRPNDPDIAYKLIAEEEIVCVASPQFIKKYKADFKNGNYLKLPHLFCERLNPDKILFSMESRATIAARFNDIAATRAACIQGAGWALLPIYALRKELQEGLLIQLERKSFGKSKYGVWWLRSRPYLKPSSSLICKWLEAQKL